MQLQAIKVEKPEEINFIFGQSHFIKTVEDIYEVLISSVPGIKFGLAFCEASGPRLIRKSGTDKEMIELAVKNAKKVGAGHSFFVFLENAFPVNVLNQIKQVPEVCRIFCATANPAEIIIVETDQGRAVLGIVDGDSPLGIETKKQETERKEFLRKIGYKL